MLLPALQTTSTASDEGALDALTLVLVVVFIASMVALTALGARRPRSDDAAHVPGPLDNPDTSMLAPPAPRPQVSARSSARQPAWLQGVAFPHGDARLTEASRVIEALLAARRDHDLQQGVALYSPSLLEELKYDVGVDDDGLQAALRNASFEGTPPELRSIEIVSAAGERMSVRAGYTNGASETYRLARIDGCWRIEGIEPR